MPTHKRPRDLNQLAKHIVGIATGEIEDKPKVNGHHNKGQIKGGIKGGAARAERLTKEQRVEIARNAAKKRWQK